MIQGGYKFVRMAFHSTGIKLAKPVQIEVYGTVVKVFHI